jgi:hypothetical protein
VVSITISWTKLRSSSVRGRGHGSGGRCAWAGVTRGNADGVAGFDPVARIGFLAIDRSCPVRAQRETRLKLTSSPCALEPAVEPDAVVVRGDGEGAGSLVIRAPIAGTRLKIQRCPGGGRDLWRRGYSVRLSPAFAGTTNS